MHTNVKTIAGALCLGFVWICLTGFAPFKSEGLAIFRVADGEGLTSADQTLAWRTKETPALFHTLSSRFGGGGTLIYMEYQADKAGVSGLLLVDLRHAGIADFESTAIGLPDRRRAEVFYQEWDAAGDVFTSQRVEGEIQILDMYRGQRVSAVAISMNITFYTAGVDEVFGTADDRWRKVEGRAITSPTVDEAVEIESEAVFDRRASGDRFAPDGNIYVSCVGDAYVEETVHDEESYYYEDDDGGGCEGDTWEDDTRDPQESGGCAGETAVDDGEPNPDGGCEGGDEFEEPLEEESSDSFYEDDDYEGDSGCEGDTTDDSGDDDDEQGDEEESAEGEDDGSDCAGDEVQASMPPGRRAGLRRALVGEKRPLASARRHRFDKGTRRTMRRILNHTPFFLVLLLVHGWRRRHSQRCDRRPWS